MKKTIISLFLAITFILSMSVSVFAGDYYDPRSIVKVVVEQVVAK